MELKPCPFCGSAGEAVDCLGEVWYQCSNKGCPALPCVASEDDWNRRATTEIENAALERAARVCDERQTNGDYVTDNLQCAAAIRALKS